LRLTIGSLKNNIKLIILYFSIFFILIACTHSAAALSPDNAKNLSDLNRRFNQQAKKIEKIENQLKLYQTVIDNNSHVNDEISQLKYELNNELKITLDKLSSDSIEQNLLDILNTVQKKIKILEDRTFYTDSLYFEIVNDMVLVENKISSLILSFKEINDLSANKANEVIPKITDEEYTAKYIESLSHYQNAEWDLSLNGFNYLIQRDKNHELADNCQYWIGEIYYALTEYKRSIKEFKKVATFPGTNKLDDAQFKMGLCYMNIDQVDRARQEFKNLLEFYPNSEYYKRSQDYLRQN